MTAAIDLSGVDACLLSLAADNIYVRHDGSICATPLMPGEAISACTILWGRARKLHRALSDALDVKNEGRLTTTLGP